jgi:hypothetical protein
MAQSFESSISTHVYRALEGPEHIRLILLHPALSKDAPLRINFLSSTLEDLEGRYEAISYTWGQPILTFALHVDDGTHVFITENLDRALRYLRRADRDRLLWADAASINQTDNKEKAVQIPLMVQIFRGAQRVMAWLDPGGDTTVEQAGMRKLDLLSRASRIARGRLHEIPHEVLLFLSLPWFNRLWIVQEIVFSLEICLICGTTELPFSRLVSALSVVEPFTQRDSHYNAARLEAIGEIVKLWDRYSLFGEVRSEREAQERGLRMTISPIEHTDIISLVERFGSYGCTDPRDRIFALCSMATDIRTNDQTFQADDEHSSETEDDYPKETPRYDTIPLDIDYSLNVMETYTNFVHASLEKPMVAGLIWKALLSRQYSPRPIDWPSWVPDWRVSPHVPERMLDGAEFDFAPKLSKSATGVLRVTLSAKAYIRGEENRGRHIIKSKTSRYAKGARGSFESQLWGLSKLYKLLQKREKVREHDHLSGKLGKNRQQLYQMDLPNPLVDMVKAIVLRHSSVREDFEVKEVFVELDRYLARNSMASEGEDSLCSSESASVQLRGLLNNLYAALGDTNTLFCFQDLAAGIHSIGYGNVALEPGDRLLPLEYRPRISIDKQTESVLILRPVDSMEGLDDQQLVYRLVGSGRIIDPITDMIGMVHMESLKEDFQSYLRMRGEKPNIVKEMEMEMEMVMDAKVHFASLVYTSIEHVLYLV